ncbi:MAG TPA: tyrosine-protein phosphatase [Polyangia bacterium]|nr:tyrosine-protein phosphatase [Polyangia bacterium]
MRRRFLLPVGLALALAWSSLAAARSERDDDAGAPPARVAIATEVVDRPLADPRDDVAGAPNLAEFAPGLWRSAQPSAAGFKNLKALGIRTVVSLRRLQSDRPALAGLGLRYFHIHFAPWHPEDEDVVKFLKIVSDPDNQPVLVHCQYGADRTGTMVAIYRVYAQGWAMNEAMQELPRFGFHSIWWNLKRYLQRLNVAGLRAKVAAVPAPAARVVP